MAECKTQTIAERLVSEVSDRRDTDPIELHPPLYEVVDLEALNTLFSHRNGTFRDTDGHVEFTYEELRIRVASDGTIDIDDVEDAE